MGDSTKVRWHALDAEGTKLSNYANNEIRGQLEKIQALRKKVTWEGADAEASLQGFDEFIVEMQKLANAVDRYGKFLNAAAGTYEETSGTIKSTFENQIYQRKVA